MLGTEKGFNEFFKHRLTVPRRGLIGKGNGYGLYFLNEVLFCFFRFGRPAS
jgi:hypothetical protein